MCQIVGGDDRAVKAGAKLADWTRPFRPKLSTVKLLWQQVLPGASFLEKGARLLKLTADQHKNNRELIDLRCDRGATIVQKLGLGARPPSQCGTSMNIGTEAAIPPGSRTPIFPSSPG